MSAIAQALAAKRGPAAEALDQIAVGGDVIVGLVAAEPNFAAINATIEVDFLGQCASESLGSEYWSSSGGQPDFARGGVLSDGGQAFIVLHSTTGDGSASRIVPRLHPGAAVTTYKNILDNDVTEY